MSHKRSKYTAVRRLNGKETPVTPGGKSEFGYGAMMWLKAREITGKTKPGRLIIRRVASYPTKTHYSKHFTKRELWCKGPNCCRSVTAPPAWVDANLEHLARTELEPVRERYGKPVVLLSGYRCPIRNKEVGGAKYSQHLNGKAADFRDAWDPRLRSIVVDVFSNGGRSTYGGKGLHGDTGPARTW